MQAMVLVFLIRYITSSDLSGFCGDPYTYWEPIGPIDSSVGKSKIMLLLFFLEWSF